MKKILIVFVIHCLSMPIFGQVYQNVTLPSSYPIVLEIVSELSSDDLTEGQSIKLAVKYAVVIDGATVIRARAIAIGKILKIRNATFNYPAFVTVEATNVQTVDDRRIDIHGEAVFKGEFKGESATIKNGQIVEAISDTNVSIHGVRQ